MKNKKSEIAMIVILTVISVLFIAPIIIVFMNSFKSKLYINSTPFALPNACLLYTSPSPRDAHESRMPSSA